MIEIRKQIQDEILDFIKLKTGAPGAIVICSTSEIPCKEEISGKGCMTEHLTEEFGYGINDKYLPSFIMQSVGIEIFEDEELP